MPLKDTPWGSMRQARSAQHTPGNVPKPPRPSYLPPPPPQCSASPLPPVVSNIGKTEATVVYDRVISPALSTSETLQNGHVDVTNHHDNLEHDANISETNHVTDSITEETEEEEYEYYEEEEETSEDEAGTNGAADYEEEMVLQLDHSSSKATNEELELEVTLPFKIESVETEDETEESEDETSTTSSSDFQPSVNIVEVTDLKECEGLATVDDFTVNEVEEEDDVGEELEPDEVEEPNEEDPDLPKGSPDLTDHGKSEYVVIEDSQDVKEELDEVEEPNEEEPDLPKGTPILPDHCESESIVIEDCKDVLEETSEIKDSDNPDIPEEVDNADDLNKEDIDTAQNEFLSEEEKRQQLLRSMPTPKIPPFVKSEPPCDFHDDPTTWIEWLENEVLSFKQKQKKLKEEKLKEEEEAKRKVKEEEERKAREEEEAQKKIKEEEERKARKEEEAQRKLREKEEAKLKEEVEMIIKAVEEETKEVEDEAPKVEEEDEKDDEEPKIVEEVVVGDEDEYEYEEYEEAEEEPAEEFIEAKETLETEMKEIKVKQDNSQGVKKDESDKNELHIESHDSLELQKDILEQTVKEETLKADDDKNDEQKDQVLYQDNDKSDLKNNEQKADDVIEQNLQQNQRKQRAIRSCEKESDPMEIVEKMRQMRQNRVLQRHVSADGTATLPSAPSFLRVNSNPDGTRIRSRPSSVVAEDNLDEMLGRVRKLREERQQILKDMAMLKDAFKEPEAKAIEDETDDGPKEQRGRQASIDSGIGPSKSVTTEGSDHLQTRKISHQSSENSDVIYCFICDEELGKLSKGAVMHMGLEDGEPICPEALNLTEQSKEKIKNIALTKHLDLKSKYEFLEILDLDLVTGDEYDLTAEDVLQRVENFLDDVEEQKKRDQEQFDLLRAGAIDEVFAEFLNIPDSEIESGMMTNSVISELDEDDQDDQDDQDDHQGDQVVYANGFKDDDTNAFEAVIPDKSPIPPPPPPPPPVPPAAINSATYDHLKEARSDLLNSIKSNLPKLKPANTDDKSEPSEAGKVLHKHLAPRVFTKEVRNLMHEIQQADPKAKLKKAKTIDKSRPYIPNDIEIYFYAGPNADKNLAPPPASREIPNKKSPSPPPPVRR